MHSTVFLALFALANVILWPIIVIVGEYHIIYRDKKKSFKHFIQYFKRQL